jgi:DNA polymerase II large subunit
LPLNFEEFSYVSNEFYLKPLMPVFNDDGLFYLLTLKADEVKFYEGMRDSITEIRIEDLVPSRIEDRVGYDHEQKNLQFRTQTRRKRRRNLSRT